MFILALATPLIQHDAVILAILLLILAIVLKTSSIDAPFFKKFYTFVPPILICYFGPGILSTANIIAGGDSGVYFIAAQYLLPASLILLIMGVDLKELWNLRRKAGIMFLVGSFGIVIGGPLAILLVSSFAPDVIIRGMGPDASWRGLATVAGSWSGGSANMAALYEVFEPSNRVYSGMIALDVIIANIWLATLLYGVPKSKKINAFFNATDDGMEEMQQKFEAYKERTRRVPSMPDLMIILAIGFGGTGLAHFMVGKIIPWIQTHAPYLEKFNLTSEFFWLIVITSTLGLLLSLTRARKLEGAGASSVGSVFLYILVASIGMQMNILNVFSNPGLLVVGLVWILIHVALMIAAAKLFKISYFFLAVASEANIGGAPTASIVAAAFHPSLIPVAVLVSVFGYAIGNYAGYLCGILMQLITT